MENQSGPRKASDIVLELESKVDTLISIIKSQDLNIRLLSNKLNNLMDKLDKQPAISLTPAQPFRAEATNTKAASTPPSFVPPAPDEKQIPIFAEFKIPLEESPEGFRRTSRPETYSGDDAYLKRANVPMEAIKFQQQQGPKPPPGRTPNDVIVPPKATAPLKPPPPPPPPSAPVTVQPPQNINAVPVQQRVVNKDNKTIFLADVEVIDLQTNESVYKGRTNGAGKWMASLVPGNYRVTIIKREPVTKQKVEVVQDIQVDGSKSPLELPIVIIK